MNLLKKAYCRTLLGIFYLAKPFLPYHIPEILKSIDEIPPLLQQKGKQAVLLVTDKGLRSLGLTAGLEAMLEKAGILCTVYDSTSVNPTVANVEEALAAYRAGGCQAIIAFGGGSAMDCAKTVGARVAKPKKAVNQMGGLLRVRGKTPLLFAIPTTAGTGSEATPATVISDRETGHKYTINDFCLAPNYAVLDPKVTFSLPPHLTATTGIDALSHNLEAYVGRSTTKTTRAQSLEAIKLVLDNIERAYEDGQNYEARANLLKASFLGGLTMSQSYVGYAHAIAHTLGGTYNIPHGLAISVVLPVVLEGYGKAAHKKLSQVARYCGLADREDPREVAAEKFIARLRALCGKMGVPNSFPQIRREDIPAMARYADREANPLYPVPKLWDARKLETYYEKIADGRKTV